MEVRNAGDDGPFRMLFYLVLLAGSMLLGCSKGGPGGGITSGAFDSAPAEIKQLWTGSLGAWKDHHYKEAASSFVSLQSSAERLSTEQKDALEKAVGEFGQQAFDAANKGDASATEAVKLLRSNGRRSSIGQ